TGGADEELFVSKAIDEGQDAYGQAGIAPRADRAARRSGERLDREVELRSARVGDSRLTERLDGERHDDQRVHELEQVQRVLRHVGQWELVAVVECRVGAREHRVVERLQLVHGAVQARGVSGGLVRQTPFLGIRFEVGELGGKQRTAHSTHPFSRWCWYSSTQSATTLWRCRHRTSWSFSGNDESTPDSSIVCVASSVLQSWRPYSLCVARVISWATRSRAVRDGVKYRLPSKMCELCEVGQ